MSFFHQFKHGTPDWEAYIDHKFVRQLADGSLPKACFKHYLQQDYAFLIQFTRAWALALYKSRDLTEMREAQAGINAMLDLEIGLHIDYYQQWGIEETALGSIKESAACVAYTRYVLDCGMSGGLADLYAALLPCIYGYAEIGQRLLNAGVSSNIAVKTERNAETQADMSGVIVTTHTDTKEVINNADDISIESGSDNPYQAWIDMYSCDEYQAVAQAAKTKFNWLCKEVSATKLEQLQHIFSTATRMEVAFWQMGLDLS